LQKLFAATSPERPKADQLFADPLPRRLGNADPKVPWRVMERHDEDDGDWENG
jgi:hypothetical protein